MVEAVLEGRHGSAAFVDEVHQSGIGLGLDFTGTKVGHVQALSYVTPAAIRTVTYQAIGLKNTRPVRV
ncbi:MAG: hypothetical protein ABI076_07400 [Acidobacteriaceae bacterium]